MRHTHNRRVTPVNKLGMWVLIQNVSIEINVVVQYVQYLGDDGEVGEVGEYFGDAGVISTGAGGWVSIKFCYRKVINNTYMLRIEGNEERTSVTSKFACLENLLGESSNISCQAA